MRTTRTRTTAVLAASAVALLAACGSDGTPSVSFADPGSGDTISGSVEVVMTADGITIEPAGEVSDGAGHFHVIADAGCVEAGETIPNDADHAHFGKGQLDGSITLEPGPHELCLQVGDGEHAALAATDTVSITVAITSRDEWCSVIGEVDELFAQTDASGLPFPDQQAVYERVRRLVAQLDDGIDQVDAEVRPDVAETLDFASRLSTALVEAATPEDAEPELERIFGEFPDEQLPAADWIRDNCDVDIDD